MFNVSLVAAATTDEFIWTGGTCCGQNQPQYIHNPAALVIYFLSPGPNNSPGAYTTCTAPPTALGQSCYVYAWSTHLPYTSEANCPIDELSTDPNDPNGLEALIKQYDKTEEEKLLTIKLENKFDAYSLLSPETRNAEQCLAGRIASELLQENSDYKVTATVRTLAYQAHLRKLWDKFFDLKRTIKKKPAIKQMCPALIAKVEGEMGFRLDQDPTDPDSICTAAGRNHCIRSIPADPNKDPKHAVKLAFDISQTAVKNYQNILLPPRTMATEANACKLTWGGDLTPIDRVHFLCCVK